MTSITIPDSVTSMGDFAFAVCTGLTSITIPSSVTSIGEGAFEDCINLSSIIIPSGVTIIGKFAFFMCTGLQTVTFEKNSLCEIIGNRTFSGCNNLNSITIPESVTSIDYKAFYGCDNLSVIYCEAPSKPYAWSADWHDDDTEVIWGYKANSNKEITEKMNIGRNTLMENELKKRAEQHKKHSKGMGYYKGGQLNPNAGNVEHNTGFFNNAMGASDAGSGQAMGESFEDKVAITTVDEMLDGYINNMSDEQIDSDIKFFITVARRLGVKNYVDSVVVVDGDYEYFPGYYDIEPVNSFKGGDASEYQYNDIHFIAEKLHGIVYYYFKSEEDAKKYLSSLDALNEDFITSQSSKKNLKENKSSSEIASIRKKCLEHSKTYTDNILIMENYAGYDEVACEYDINLNTLYIYSTENRHNTIYTGKLIESAPSIFVK